MLVKCCNPECESPFDFREGRLIRFSSKPPNDSTLQNRSVIQHFWLCGRCALIFVFECESGIRVKITPRRQESTENTFSNFISTA
jgi:hypothetical protein